ncbi:MAG: hypothetical protein ACHP83_12675 [Burkholderiales bacterium]
MSIGKQIRQDSEPALMGRQYAAGPASVLNGSMNLLDHPGRTKQQRARQFGCGLGRGGDGAGVSAAAHG